MLETALAAKVATLPAQQFNLVTIRGKVSKSKKLPKGGYATRFTLPAADEYSSAQTIEIYSKEKIGEVEEVMTVKAVLGGYYKRDTNKNTGEVMDFCHNVLRAVE